MANTYFFVPIAHETELTTDVDLWITYKFWTAITGVYKEGTYRIGNSSVVSMNPLGYIGYIPLGMKREEQGVEKQYQLIGFTLEADFQRLETQVPDTLKPVVRAWYNELVSMPDVVYTTQASKYIDFINKIK